MRPPTEENAAPMDTLHAWRHPRARGTEGRCIGRTDVPVDPRRTKRLARRIQRAARDQGLPRIVVTSPLRRCADVGRWLRRWGWQHHIDPALLEADFGAWDGRLWAEIGRADIDAWCEDFAHHAPGGGEPLAALFARTAAWQPHATRIVVAHAGWMQARLWLEHSPGRLPSAAEWAAPPRHGQHIVHALTRV